MDIDIRNLSKSYDSDKMIIEGLDLHIENGAFTVLVGPSGCGKTTLLRLIAGLEDVTGGNIFIGDRDVTCVDSKDRDIAMVFQNYALYPHMSVGENINFGLKNIKVPKPEREQIITEVLTLVDLSEYENTKPGNMSGGQRQRVALARAISKKPMVFLMDEPLSNLDAKLRGQMRSELILLHNKLRTTFVYVTHDQVEAMTMGDHIVIMNFGKIMQSGTPRAVYHDPENVFVAQFIGNPGMNILKFDSIQIGFRANAVEIANSLPENKSNFLIPGEVLTKELLGDEILYSIETLFGVIQVAQEIEIDSVDVEINAKVYCVVDERKLYYFDMNGDRIRERISFAEQVKILEDRV